VKNNEFWLHKYYLPSTDNNHNNCTTLLIRERSLVQQTFTLADLTSHHRDHHIDNTGNVCVWDCEKTLLWALLQTNKTYDKLLELGAGMAGLVGLGLAATQRANHVILTDGNPKSLQSNRIQFRLWECYTQIQDPSPPRRPLKGTTTWEVQLLPWVLYPYEEDNNTVFQLLHQHPADLTVVSDCTHFEQYHGHLVWTLLQCTAVGGDMYMCHPNRGASLHRFLTMVQFLSQPTTTPSLLSWQELLFDRLNQKHDELSKTNTHYQPNIHRPRIFHLVKQREATEMDRTMIMDHVKKKSHG
jgi:hypothetical protein